MLKYSNMQQSDSESAFQFYATYVDKDQNGVEATCSDSVGNTLQ